MNVNITALSFALLISHAPVSFANDAAADAASKKAAEQRKKVNCQQLENEQEIFICLEKKLSITQAPNQDGPRAGDGKATLKTWMAAVNQAKTGDASGIYCAPPPGAYWRLWRADNSQAQTLEIKTAQGQTQKLQWPAGKTLLYWPDDLSLTENSRYTLTLAGRETRLHFRQTPANLSRLALIEWMADVGCRAQATYLYQTYPKIK